MDTTAVWCDGRLRSPDEPVVRATDRGLTSGLGVYESLAVIDGRTFALTRHLARLARSAQVVGVRLPGDDVLRGAVEEVVGAGRWPYGRLRITVTAGASDEERGTVVVTGTSARPVDRVRVVRVPWVRNERSAVAGAKSLSSAGNLVAARAASAAGADEAVLANGRGELCECTTSNVLVELSGALLTPPLSSGCLGGVTRELLLEWSAGWDVPVREQTMPYTILDEVAAGRAGLAVSSTSRTVVPVTELDGHPSGDTPSARRARELFDARRRDDLDP
ncbi:MAG: aminotransferase class IV [Micrococcales bacterium]|nr:aminotransferase class IV [Micrococcales bacterium]